MRDLDADRRARARHRERYWAGRSKADYRCPVCGRGPNETVAIDVHHQDGNPQNGAPDNLIGLCRRCHLQKKHERDGPHGAPPFGPEQPRGTAPREPTDLSPVAGP
jgi:5-methylcytosine-specific restriction endonuclease McrA